MGQIDKCVMVILGCQLCYIWNGLQSITLNLAHFKFLLFGHTFLRAVVQSRSSALPNCHRFSQCDCSSSSWSMAMYSKIPRNNGQNCRIYKAERGGGSFTPLKNTERKKKNPS